MISVRHIGIVVGDLDRSLEFYCGLLGMSVVRRALENGPFVSAILGMNDAEVETVKMSGADVAQVELLAFRSPRSSEAPPGLTRRGPTHMALTVDNLDELHIRMRAKAVPFTTAPLVSPDGKAKVTFCQDPDGTYLELVEVQKAPGS